MSAADLTLHSLAKIGQVSPVFSSLTINREGFNMASQLLTKLTLATAGAAVLAIGSVCAPAEAAFKFSFKTKGGGSGSFLLNTSTPATLGSVTNFSFSGSKFIKGAVSGLSGIGGFISGTSGKPTLAGFLVPQSSTTFWGGLLAPKGTPIVGSGILGKASLSINPLFAAAGTLSTGGASVGTNPFSGLGLDGGLDSINCWDAEQVVQTEEVPEPFTVLGSIVGVGGLLAARRKRQMTIKAG